LTISGTLREARVQGWIANTHSDWFDFLARKGVWEEVNFWTPSDYYAFTGPPEHPSSSA